MRKLIMTAGLYCLLFSGIAQQTLFDAYPVYDGDDLGLTYTETISKFRIWSPVAEKAELLIYDNGSGGIPRETVSMKKSEGGTWLASLAGDYNGKFYVFRIRQDNKWLREIPDPYAKIVGVNGQRAMIADLDQTDPPGWEKDSAVRLNNPTDGIIYELHIRDASIATNSGIRHAGKFSGLTERGTTNKEGLSTGLDHLRDLGVTHIHLLPSFDFNSIDETKPDRPAYNWGYDPLNYNVPEGSYCSDPIDGRTRIKEFKQLIKTFHENGLNVVMDVVYNHTALTADSYFNQMVPGYYYRQNADGKFSDATACGNETASERPMVRKFMLESLKYWVREYHIDGFRVDLMGVHDLETMNLVAKELRTIKPDILLYGEGWTAGASPLPDSLRALKKYAYKLDHIAVFSDDIRDGIKGSVFNHGDQGFVSGKPGMEETIKFGVVASCQHPQVDYSKVNYSKAPYSAQPYHTITYCECHDNHVLWDKLKISAKEATEDERKEMHKLALSIVLTSQGISFLHAGTEFLRTKHGIENSYQSPDSINQIDWSFKTKNRDVFDYVKALIQIRKQHPAFRLSTASQIAAHIRFVSKSPSNVIAYTINGAAVSDQWKKIFVAYNGNAADKSISLPRGQWKIVVEQNKITDRQVSGKITLKARSCTILHSF